MRVVFVSHTCCLHGVGGCLATHARGYTCVHAQIVLHTSYAYTHTHEVFTRGCFLLVSHSMYILQSSYCFSVINTCLSFSKGFSLQDWTPDYAVSRAKYRGPDYS